MANLPGLLASASTTTSSRLVDGVPNEVLLVGVVALGVVLLAWALTRPVG